MRGPQIQNARPEARAFVILTILVISPVGSRAPVGKYGHQLRRKPAGCAAVGIDWSIFTLLFRACQKPLNDAERAGASSGATISSIRRGPAGAPRCHRDIPGDGGSRAPRTRR